MMPAKNTALEVQRLKDGDKSCELLRHPKKVYIKNTLASYLVTSLLLAVLELEDASQLATKPLQSLTPRSVLSNRSFQAATE